MNANEIIILLQIHAGIKDYHKSEIPACGNHILTGLVNLKMISLPEEDDTEPYELTERGKVAVDNFLKQPLPKQIWTMP